MPRSGRVTLSGRARAAVVCYVGDHDPAGEMRRVVREAVVSYRPPGALAAVCAVEESEREGLRIRAEFRGDGFTEPAP